MAAIVFGILGLSAAKKGKATNRGMSIAGIVLGVVWIVLGIVASVAFILFIAHTTSSAMANAKVGDCYVSTTENISSIDGAGFVFGSCDKANAEVYYVGTYDGTALPSDDSFMDEAGRSLCVGRRPVRSRQGHRRELPTRVVRAQRGHMGHRPPHRRMRGVNADERPR